MAPGRRRVGAHAAGRRSGAHARRRPAAAAGDRRHARRGLPRLRQAGDDGVHRRPHPIDRSRGAGRRAGHGVSRSPEHPLDRRLRRPPAGAGHRRAAPEARACGSRSATKSATARSAGWRRRWTSSCWRGSRSPIASGASRALQLRRRWTGSSSARAALGVEHRPPAPILLGRHLLELGMKPGREMGEILKSGLRTAAGRSRSRTSKTAIAAARALI